MNPTIKAALITVAAIILGALITGAVGYKQYIVMKQQLESTKKDLADCRKIYEEAPREAWRQLDSLINRAYKMSKSEGTQYILRDAHAIVSSRNGLRSSLEVLGNHLDSDIDEIEAELRKPRPDPNKLLQLIEILKQKWPSKETEIIQASRKILIQFGIVLKER